MFGENCLVVTPIHEDSGMSLNEQSDVMLCFLYFDLAGNSSIHENIVRHDIFSQNQRHDTLSQNQNLIQPDPSEEILPCAETLQQPSTATATGDMAEGNHSKESSDSGSVVVSESGSCSDSGSHSESGTGSVVSLEESPIPPSKETLSENPKDQISMGKTSLQVSDPNESLNENQALVLFYFLIEKYFLIL